MTGFCSNCHRVWRLEERQGICSWCSRNAYCATSTTKPRHPKSNRRRQRTQGNGNGTNGYDHLPEPYLTYYRVALRFAHKAVSGEKDDLLHTIIEALAKVGQRKADKAEDFTEAAMHRTAEHVKDWYWYKRYAYNNGLSCRNCTKEQQAKCRYNWGHSDWAYCDCHRAVRLESLNQPVTDHEGNVTELGDLIADDKGLDLVEWVDARTWLLGAPLRLKAIALKRQKGEKLTQPEHNYLNRLRRKRQKAFV